MAVWPLPGGLALRGNYTWNETATPGGRQRPFRPKHVANLGLDYAASSGRLRLAANLRASRAAVGTAGEALDDYLLMDLHASYQTAAGVTVYARLENALDERYREIPTYFTARQAAYAGVRYDF